MLLTGASVGGVVYPPNLGKSGDDEDDDWEDEDSDAADFWKWKVKGPDPVIFWKSFTFPRWDPDKDFTAEMMLIERKFEAYLEKIKSPPPAGGGSGV